MRDATLSTARGTKTDALFQSTHPMRDATNSADMRTAADWYFNPRIPCGMRRPIELSVLTFITISIHASHAGCDLSYGRWRHSTDNFNPRIPCGMRQNYTYVIYPELVFQSTHPMRDATSTFVLISSYNKWFQSTHPMRDATQPSYYPDSQYKFQSTHPMRDATIQQICEQLRIDISIHASHAGCDEKLTIKATKYRKFQSTHPMRDATLKLNKQDTRYVDFNPRIPCGMRPALQVGMR